MKIVAGIREVALEVQKNPAMKNALRIFVKQQLNDKPEYEPTQVKEALSGTPVDMFWEMFIKLLTAIDSTPNNTLVQELQGSSLWTNLQHNSMTNIRTALKPNIIAVLRRLDMAMQQAPQASVGEALSNLEFVDLLNKLLELTEHAQQLQASQIWRRIQYTAKQQFLRLPGNVKNILDQLNQALSTVQEATEKPVDPTPAGDAQASFEYKDEGDSLHIKSQHFDFTLAGENLERAIKAVDEKKTLTVQCVDGKFMTFSPRGSSVMIKAAGQNTKELMTAPDADAFIEAAKGVLDADADTTLVDAAPPVKVKPENPSPKDDATSTNDRRR
jgi:hypothetical protein